jgi:hypothetical protein
MQSSQTRAWQVVAEFTLPSPEAADPAARAGLAEAERKLALPPAFVDQLAAALVAAACRLWDHDAAAGALAVAVRAMQPARAKAGGGWGFFLLKKCAGQPPRQAIELDLYQDGG